MSYFHTIRKFLSLHYIQKFVLDYCTALGFKVVGGRKNEDGKQVAIITDIVPNSIAEKNIKLMVGK